MNPVGTPIRIGLLGGGQLARMLALKAHEIGMEPHVYSSQGTDPAAQVVRHFHRGELHDVKALADFLSQVDLATFESEFLDAETLAAAEGPLPKIFPRASLMGRLQDRLTQKDLLVEAKINTLPHQAITSLEDAREFLRAYKQGIALKQRRFGYDGYGTFMVRNEEELDNLFAHWGVKVPPLIAEPRCKFRRELAISLVRRPSGDMIVFPLVESHQADSRCKWVKGPVSHRALPPLLKRMKAFLNRIDYVGMMAFELFDLGRELVVNELAPRVHNSAHYSLDALSLDQFSAHLLALMDAPLKIPRAWNKGFAMVNLLGTHTSPPQWAHVSDVKLHWYGKLDNRPGRKMGHLNAVGRSADEALRIALKAERKFNL